MNIMTLQRYRNEIILLLTLLFALFAFFYKLSAKSYVQENKAAIQKQISEITKISNYQKQWDGKGMSNKVNVLKSIVNASKVQSFQKKSKKLIASYVNLTANELNQINNKLLNMPIQIVNLEIKEQTKNQFTMELTCKW
ncbi:hypothetical protein KKC13_02470 [bacterium]|nr:hypothetical protein [bacterium]MBU1958404.1 hypothetical protein [bacterium]